MRYDAASLSGHQTVEGDVTDAAVALPACETRCCRWR